jgi:hypothetical protein
MKYRKFNKYEKKEVRAQVIQNALHGEGLYLFRNHTQADLTLPRPTKSGQRIVLAGKEFQGDDYYMQLVRQGLLRLVKEIQSPEQQRAALTEASVEDKLLLEQPDTVTPQGKVEHVVAKAPAQHKLNEGKKSAKPAEPDVLLNENPVDDGFVIVGN